MESCTNIPDGDVNMHKMFTIATAHRGYEGMLGLYHASSDQQLSELLRFLNSSKKGISKQYLAGLLHRDNKLQITGNVVSYNGITFNGIFFDNGHFFSSEETFLEDLSVQALMALAAMQAGNALDLR